jgi:ATP-dependent 26S proteasome regulatory subunit
MLNKRNKNILHKRTHIDVNNFNKFLTELDKTNIKQQQFINSNIHTMLKNIDNKYENSLYNDTFKTYNNNFFTTENKTTINIDDTNTHTDNNIITKININVEINNINDILQLIETYPLNKNVEYNINMEILHKIKEPLIKLNNMIGLTHIKQNIVDQILFYIQNLHSFNNTSSIDFMHTVIYGPPGTGKTDIAKIIGTIFSKIGILKKGTFKKVTRSDLVAGYLGQTALKTRDVIKEALGGVLFIDEAYALGNNDKIDSFSKECIDTLCEALSDHKDNLMVIIAGYENELNDCFFNINQGLNSRFTWRFKIDEYNAEDLYNIFIKKVTDYGWSINDNDNSNINSQWFDKNKQYFKFYGRDIETLLTKVKIAHSKRVFCKNENEKKKLILNDLEKGFNIYLQNLNNIDNKREKFIYSMYT